MTPKERAAMQQALEALEVSTDWDVGAKGKQLQSMKAITTLREALKQPVSQEPVTISCECGDIYERNSWGGRFIKLHGICPNCDAALQAAPQPVSQEPVAWYSDKGGFNDCGEGKPLYTAPVRTKDLTDDEICKANKTELPDCQDLVDFARAVIAKYKEKQK